MKIKSCPLFILLILTNILSNSCTIQKRIHSSGYHIEFRKQTFANTKTNNLKVENTAQDNIISDHFLEEKIVSEKEVIVEKTIFEKEKQQENIEPTSKKQQLTTKMIAFSTKMDEKIKALFPSQTTDVIAIKKDQLIAKIPSKIEQLAQKNEKRNFIENFARGVASVVGTVIFTIFAIAFPVLILLLLIPAIILTTLAKKHSENTTKSRNLWIGAWICWGLIFLLFILLIFILIILVNL